MEETVDGRRGQRLGHDLVESGRMKVARNRDRASFVCGINQAVEALGGVLGDGQQTDVVDDDQVRADDLGEGPGDGVVRAVAADQGSQVLDGEPGDGQAGFDRGLSEGLGEVAFPRPRGSTDAKILAAADPLQTLEGVLGGPGYG